MVADYWFPGDLNSDGVDDVAVNASDRYEDVAGLRVWSGGALSGTYTFDDDAFFYLWGSDVGESPGWGAPQNFRAGGGYGRTQ